MRSEWNVGEGVRRSLWRLAIQENHGTRRIALNRERGDFLTWAEFQSDFRSHASAHFNILLDRLVVIQRGSELMHSERHVGEAVSRAYRRLSVQEN